MGRAHSNAYGQVKRFFNLPIQPALHTIVGRNAKELAAFAARWGYVNKTTSLHEAVMDEAVDLVDIATPNHVHAEPALLALSAGKHVACEKPLAGTLEDARSMRNAARKSRGKTFVWFNYRRCPAVALAHRLVKEKRLGRIYHVRAQYLQSWGGPQTPMLWRFNKKEAGSGAHGDLNAHIVDMARFITGDEITEVNGAIRKTFVKERKDLATGKMKRSSVDDCVLFLASFKQGAVGSFEATRLAHGNHNANKIEINGEKGSLRFNFEDMNWLEFCDASDGAREGGFRRIMCTSAGNHPYAENWWPDAHILGYEHGFTNMAADIMRAIAGRKPEVPLPDFDDAYQTQRVLEAALVSARNRCSIKLQEIR